MASGWTSSSRLARWRGAAEVLAHLRGRPQVTRADLVRALGMSSGSATEITGRLRAARLLTEVPAPVAGRGRPTTVLRPHPLGPLVLALELKHEEWRSTLVGVDGVLRPGPARRHRGREPAAVLADLAGAVQEAHRRHPGRVRAVSLSVAATVRDGHLVQASTLGWRSVDLAPLVAGTDSPLLVGNDATLAGVAEARTGAAAGARTALHLLVEVGIGGSLIVDGFPVASARGAGGEYGHLPFGDRSLPCPCGAHGCWDLEVDGRALARHLGEAAPEDPRTYAQQVLQRASGAGPGSALREAARTVSTALAAGTAGLVNAHDPDVVTLGGLAVLLRAAASDAFDAAYLAGLMAYRRQDAPPVLDAAHQDDGALDGAAAVGLDHLTSESALAAWAEQVPRA